ncbi:MAG TPA: HD domain-containing phosphohydrolase [Gemmatimonadales bacterium]|nr:HD domain-containing phosphohydrolase [Gemmatimonadales bacterium]
MTDPIPTVSLLVVDDEEALRNALVRYLNQQGFKAYGAGSAAEALAMVRTHRVAAVLLDVRMPDKSGVDTVPDLLAVDKDLAIVMLTAVNDATTASLCLQRGAVDYLTKPIDLADLDRAIRNALRKRDQMIESQQKQHWLKEEVAERTAELRRERAKLERLSVATLEALVNALEAKDAFSRGHSARVADLAALVCAELGGSDQEVETVRAAGRLHDIGKIGIHEMVLNKQGPLTPEEYEHVKGHVLIGSQILAPLTHLGDIIPFVRHHHEQWDGNGYPDGLAGEAIPLGARILCTAEIYDALTTARPYQDKMSPDDAIHRMEQLAGRVLDPTVLAALGAVVRRRNTLTFIDEVSG